MRLWEKHHPPQFGPYVEGEVWRCERCFDSVFAPHHRAPRAWPWFALILVGLFCVTVIIHRT